MQRQRQQYAAPAYGCFSASVTVVRLAVDRIRMSVDDRHIMVTAAASRIRSSEKVPNRSEENKDGLAQEEQDRLCFEDAVRQLRKCAGMMGARLVFSGMETPRAFT